MLEGQQDVGYSVERDRIQSLFVAAGRGALRMPSFYQRGIELHFSLEVGALC